MDQNKISGDDIITRFYWDFSNNCISNSSLNELSVKHLENFLLKVLIIDKEDSVTCNTDLIGDLNKIRDLIKTKPQNDYYKIIPQLFISKAVYPYLY